MLINPDGLCDTKSVLSFSPHAPGKGRQWKLHGVGAFPCCLTATRTRGHRSPPNLDGQGAALPAGYFSCVGWDAESAVSFTGDKGGTPDATPVHMLPYRKGWEGPPC